MVGGKKRCSSRNEIQPWSSSCNTIFSLNLINSFEHTPFKIVHDHIEDDINVIPMPSAWQELLLWEDRNSFWISRNVLFLVSGMIKKMYVAVKEQITKNTRKQYCCSPIYANKRNHTFKKFVISLCSKAQLQEQGHIILTNMESLKIIDSTFDLPRHLPQ